jgi:Asp-tRNA(Asn)/Glu-tRNA(Gln) amidotransferase A subunit family amidase
MSGKHNDSTSYFTLLGDWYEQISTMDSREITVAIARNTLDMKANPYSSAAVIKAAEFFSLMGVNVVDIEISLPDHVLSTAIVTGESKIEDIARYGTALDELDERAKGELALKYMLGGTDTLTNARRMRNSLAQSFERTLSNVSAFICPTVNDDGSPSPVLEALALTGICGITVPCGQSSQTSLGLLIAGRQFSEPVILRMCHLYQNANKKLKEASRRGRRAKIPTKN